MVIRTEASQLHLLRVFDLLCIAVAPFNRHFGVCIGVDKHVKGAVTVQYREECDGRRDLAENRLYLVLDLLLRLLNRRRLLGVGRPVRAAISPG